MTHQDEHSDSKNGFSTSTTTTNFTCNVFTHLPLEILTLLTTHLHNIEDFTALSNTSTYLHHNLLSLTTPQTLLDLAAASGRIFFRPHPYFLLAHIAPQLSLWARSHPTNTATFTSACRGGIESLFELVLDPATRCGITLEDIRSLHRMRYEVINPITDMLDKAAGAQWYAQENFWDGGVEDAKTLDVDPPEMFFQLAIYGGLFGHAFESLIPKNGDGSGRGGGKARERGEEKAQDIDTAVSDATSAQSQLPLQLPVLDVNTRLEFIKYNLPDWCSFACQSSAMDVRLPSGAIHPHRRVDAVGPYTPLQPSEDEAHPVPATQLHNAQLGAMHILRCRKWRYAWNIVRSYLGGDFVSGGGIQEEEFVRGESGVYDVLLEQTDEMQWKQLIWECAVMFQGLEGFRMIRHWEEPRRGDVEVWRGKLEGIRKGIEGLGEDERPEVTRVGRQRTFREVPFLWGDCRVCSSGYALGQ